MEPRGRTRWAIGGLLAGGIVVNFLDRTAISVASSSIADEFGLDLQQLGVVLSAFTWSYCLVQLPAGMLVDLLGVSRLTRIASALWAVAGLLTAVAGGVGPIILARLLLGVAEGPSMVGASKATASWFPVSERGMATALFDGATKLANMVAFPVLAFVMSEWGWRAGFLFCAAVSALFTAVWWWGYRDPSEYRSLGPAEREFILRGGARDTDRGGLRQFRTALGSGRVWVVACGFACYGYTINIVLTWMPEFLQREFHVRLLQSGLYSMVPWAVATVAELAVGGWLVDRLIRRGRDPWVVRRTVLTCGLALGATIGAAGGAGSPALAVCWMSVSLAGLAIAAPVAWGLPGLLAPPGAVGAVSGLMNFLNTAATAGGVLLTGWLAQVSGSFATPFLFAVGVLAVGVALYWRALRPASVREAGPARELHRV
ncbi:MFS transporter [Streptomyces platensis]|uniref:MFS transporter n=1 Tax=Streptomyces platensis TaxID=58346 RepID=UPI001F316888|nr:MFS transporter [Streptomyces platensis]MCF3141801.1 MFS transporter [Streptomyces platensis]